MSIAEPLEQKQHSHAPRGRSFAKKQQPEKIETYADIYFRENPNAVIDLDPPEIKIQKLNKRLESFDLEVAEKFHILMQIKSAVYILYGENSVEALMIHAKLGRLYNESHRPQSALRHLQKSQELLKTYSIDKNELIAIAVETSEAHLALRSDNRQDSQLHIKQALDLLAPYMNEEIDDADLRYRRNLVNARAFAADKKYNEALEQYQLARRAIEGQDSKGSTIANLYTEISKFAESTGNIEKATEYAGLAFELFLKLGMKGSAKYIQSKVAPEKVKQAEEMYGSADM
jgi:hypothetical protein